MSPSTLPLLLTLTSSPVPQASVVIPPLLCAPEGESCQGGSCSGYNLIVDGGFDEGCSQWLFRGSARRENGAICGSSSDRALFDGMWAGSGTLYQDIQVPTARGGSFWLGYHLESRSGTGASTEQLAVSLRDASTGAVLESIAVHRPGGGSCYQFSASLAGDYRGQRVRLQLDATTSSSSTYFRLDNVGFWQSLE